MDSFAVFPSLPVPDMTMAKGAGPGCAESQTRNSRSNQNTSGTGRAQGMAMSISSSGTLLGIGAMFCGGGPNIVARSPAEPARPVAGAGAAGAATGGTSGAVTGGASGTATGGASGAVIGGASGSAPLANAAADSMAAITHLLINVVPSLPAPGDTPPQGLLYRHPSRGTKMKMRLIDLLPTACFVACTSLSAAVARADVT